MFFSCHWLLHLAKASLVSVLSKKYPVWNNHIRICFNLSVPGNPHFQFSFLVSPWFLQSCLNFALKSQSPIYYDIENTDHVWVGRGERSLSSYLSRIKNWRGGGHLPCRAWLFLLLSSLCSSLAESNQYSFINLIALVIL